MACARGRLGLVAAMLAICAPAAAQTEFRTLAEGFTSADRGTGIVAAQRLFSVPSFPGICAPLAAPERLVAAMPMPVCLVRGEWFSYDRLVIVAVDASGNVLAPVPVAIEVEELTPSVLELRADMTADANGRVLPVRLGAFRLRFRTLCDGHSAAVTLDTEVVAR